MRKGTLLASIGLAIAVAGAAMWFRKVAQVDIPEDRTAYVVVFLTAVALGIGAFVSGVRWVGGAIASLAILLGLFFPATIAISRQEVAANAIRVGDTIPAFTALDGQGELFNSKSLHGHIALIKFFRGHW